MNKSDFDPDVYEFYKAALEGPGFAASFTEADIPMLRENEIKRHAANTDPYEVYAKYDVSIERDDADPLPVRIYVPAAVVVSHKSAPVILYFHGGGYIMGSVKAHDPLCGKLADACGAIVAAVEYRLAPEYPFPACIEDAVCAAEWVHENAGTYGGDPDRILAAGDSSGANMSAALALLGRDGKAPALSGLILFYGVYGCLDIKETESGQLYGQGEYVLPLKTIDKMMDLYIPKGTDPGDIRLNPGKAQDLSGMPPAIVVTAEMDPLRDDGEEFARRLVESGSKAECIRMAGMMHGFILYWQRFRRAEELLEEIGCKLKVEYEIQT